MIQNKKRTVGAQVNGFIFLILPVLLVLAAAYALFVWKWTYSEGERAGFVQKLSKKGFVCKTWEGELAMVSMPGAAQEKFYFTVWDDAVAENMNKHVGKRVAIYYEEKLGIPFSCFGETRHYIKQVKLLDDAPAVLPPPVPPTVVAPAVNLPPAMPAPAAAPATNAAATTAPATAPAPAPLPTPLTPK